MNKFQNAIFLDRDGVINEKRDDYVKSVSELKIFSYAAKSIKKLHDLGFVVIVITNQSAINRGLMTHNQLEIIHNTIQENLISSKTKIDAFYFCPHKPDENCLCRKPNSELIVRASNDFDIDLKSSWMIGDNDSDVLAGKNAGCQGVKIENNSDLPNTIKHILKN